MSEKREQNPVLVNEKELRISMETSFFKKLEDIKNFYGIKNNTEIIRYLIATTHREIRIQSRLTE